MKLLTSIVTAIQVLDRLTRVGQFLWEKYREHKRRKKRIKASKNPREAFSSHFSG